MEFFSQPEALLDFAYRATHVATQSQGEPLLAIRLHSLMNQAGNRSVSILRLLAEHPC